MEPGNLDIEIVRGETWNPTVQLWADANNTIPFDISGWDAALVFLTPGLINLTPGHGLVMGGSAGTISTFMSDAITAATRVSTCRWYLKVIAPTGEVIFIWRGVVTWSDP